MDTALPKAGLSKHEHAKFAATCRRQGFETEQFRISSDFSLSIGRGTWSLRTPHNGQGINHYPYLITDIYYGCVRRYGVWHVPDWLALFEDDLRNGVFHGGTTMSGYKFNEFLFWDTTTSGSVKPGLLTMDESLFCCLLEGPGMVEVDIVMLEKYFVPFVSFLADNDVPPLQYGAIVRSKSDLLAARTVAELVVLLRDIAGGSTELEIYPPEYPNRTVSSSEMFPGGAMSHWLL